MSAALTKPREPAAGRGTSDISKPAFAAGLFAVFFAILFIARTNAMFYPLPNEDDARFFYPAWTLATRGSFAVPMLNAPEGIFWMPHGFYVWLAMFMRIFGTTIAVARAVCQTTTATAAVLLVIACARLCRSRAFALGCGVLLVSPGVIFTANIIRMESLIFLILALGLLLHTDKLHGAAAAVFLLSGTVHPALALGALFYAGAVVSSGKLKAGNLLSIFLIAGVSCAIAGEGTYVARHFAVFHTHMAYQTIRKGRHGLFGLLFSSRGVLLGAEVIASAGMAVSARFVPAFRNEILPVTLLSLGLSTYAVLGREIPYNIYAYAVVPALFCCLLYRVIDDRRIA